MRESRTCGSVRGARDETRVPTAPTARVHRAVLVALIVSIFGCADETILANATRLCTRDLPLARRNGIGRGHVRDGFLFPVTTKRHLPVGEALSQLQEPRLGRQIAASGLA